MHGAPTAGARGQQGRGGKSRGTANTATSCTRRSPLPGAERPLRATGAHSARRFTAHLVGWVAWSLAARPPPITTNLHHFHSIHSHDDSRSHTRSSSHSIHSPLLPRINPSLTTAICVQCLFRSVQKVELFLSAFETHHSNPVASFVILLGFPIIFIVSCANHISARSNGKDKLRGA